MVANSSIICLTQLYMLLVFILLTMFKTPPLGTCIYNLNPCIDDFNYFKLIVHVDRTFLLENIITILLNIIGLDENRNTFPLAFKISKSEIK